MFFEIFTNRKLSEAKRISKNLSKSLYPVYSVNIVVYSGGIAVYSGGIFVYGGSYAVRSGSNTL
jgi:hypothetical protein